MLGMGAMMSATLYAPLAALTALLELTTNPHVILPGMLAIVAANLVARELLGTPSVFEYLLKARGLRYHSDPVSVSLRRVSVTQAMSTEFIQAPRVLNRQQLARLLASRPRWLLVAGEPMAQLIPAAEVRVWRESTDAQELDLIDAPVTRLDAAPINTRATLAGALRRLEHQDAEALYIIPPSTGPASTVGVLTRDELAFSARLRRRLQAPPPRD